jgi:hypothetical protein
MWAKIDDKLCTHPKFVGLPLAPRGLWVTALSWSSMQLTDGHIPRSALRLFGAQPRDARRLVEAGLWEEDGDGWRFHDWSDYQPSAWDVRESARKVRQERVEAGTRGGLKKARNRAKPASKTAKNSQQNRSPVPVPEESLRDSPSSVPPSDEPGALVPLDQTAPAKADARPKTTSTGTRLPEGWEPERSDANLHVESGHDPRWLSEQLASFRDYWAGCAGAKGRKADWEATWRNWIRRSTSDRRTNGRRAPDWDRMAADLRGETA